MKFNKRILLFIMAIMAFNQFSYAQISNDDCATAIPFTQGNFDFDGGTSSNVLSRCIDNGDQDAWFTFTPTNTNMRIGSYVSTAQGNNYDVGGPFRFSVYSGTCGNLTEYFCAYNSSGLLNIMGLDISSTYFLRISPLSENSNINLNLLIKTIVNSPNNDECIDSENIALTDSPQTIVAEIEDAFLSDAGFPSCNDEGFQYDVWYDFNTPPSGNVLIEFKSFPEDNNWEFIAYDGSCSNLTEVSCELVSENTGGGFNEYKFINLTPNNNQYLRVWDQGSNSNDNFEFRISAGLDIQNGDCGNRILLPVQPECISVSTTQLGFGGTWTQDLPSCDDFSSAGLFEPNDVWFEFKAPNTGAVVVSPGSGYTKVLYSGNCEALTEVGCQSANDGYFSGLIPEQTYVLRILNNGYSQARTKVDVCVVEASGPTTNDICDDAISIAVSSNCNNPIIGNFNGATQSGISSSGCFGNEDIWFSFSPSSSGAILVETDANVDLAIYSGSCGDLYDFSWCFNPNTVFSGLDPNETYYLQMVGSITPIEFCLVEAFGPKNNFCFGPQEFPLNDDCSAVTVDFSNTKRSKSGISGCSTNAYDLYYSITVPANGKLRTGYLSYTGAESWHNLAVLTGSCNNYTLIQCITPSDGLVDFTNLTPGEELVIRMGCITTNDEAEICLSKIPDPPANNLCSNPTSLSLSNANCNQQVGGTLLGASNDKDFCVNDKNDVFYSFIAATEGNYTVQILNSPISLTVASSVDCNGPSLECGTNSITLSLLAGESRIFTVSSFDNNISTDFDICIMEFEGSNSDGNVGIGVTAPIQKLQISGGFLVGNTETEFPGTIRYTGQDIEGYTAGQWRSMTTINGDHLGNHIATTNLNMDNNSITNLDSPSSPNDAATKNYVDNHNDGDNSSSNEIQTLSINGNTLSISDGGSVIIPDVAAANWNAIQNKPSGFSDNIDNVVDNDNDPTNEIQTWSTLGGKPSGFADNIDNVNDNDSNVSNELIDNMDFSGGILKITEGGIAHLANFSEYENHWTQDVSDDLRYFDGNVTIGSNIPPTDKLYVVNGGIDVTFNSSGNNAQMDITETGSSDGARINFKNSSSTELWTLWGRASDTNTSNDFNLYHSLTGNVISVEGETGDVGIGGTPTSDLHIFQGNSGSTDGLILQNTNNNNQIRMYTSSGTGFLLYYSTVGGSSAIASINDVTGAYNALSDKRMKKNITELEFNWQNFMKIKPLSYQYIHEEGNSRSLGMLAQDMMTLYPELVVYHKEEDLYHMNYSGLGVIAVKAVQEQQKTIESLTNTLKKQEDRIATMEQQMKEMMIQIEAMKE